MPYGIILAFKLRGRGSLPPYTPEPLPPANPSSESFTTGQIALGQKKYAAFCSICHTGPVNPDLRRSAILGNREAWKSIVMDGALESAGMASFRDYLSSNEAEAIRAFVTQQARALKVESGLRSLADRGVIRRSRQREPRSIAAPHPTRTTNFHSR